MNASRTPRLAVTLVGDITREAGAQVKYGHLVDALRRRFEVAAVIDVTLRGLPRLLNALRVIHPDRHVWQQRFYQNVPAFAARSRLAARRIAALAGQVDLILQIGALFDSRWSEPPLPSVIYTDYTQHLSGQKPEAGRSPFTAAQRARWLELEGRAYRRAAAVTTRSEFVRRSVIEAYGIPAGQVSVVGGGVNFAALPDLTGRSERGGQTLLFIGKEFYRKGGDVLLRAFARVRAQAPQARLLLVTADPLPADLPLEGVERIEATWERARIEALYRQADLFVLPSRLETWGDVLLEAMAYGLPCVGVRGEAMQEIIEDGRTGLLVPPGDEAALAQALARLLADPPMRAALGRSARERVEASFTWDRVVEQLTPVLQSATGSSGFFTKGGAPAMARKAI